MQAEVSQWLCKRGKSTEGHNIEEGVKVKWLKKKTIQWKSWSGFPPGSGLVMGELEQTDQFARVIEQ